MLASLILVITIGAADVKSMEQAYSQWLGYSTVERGKIDKQSCRGLGHAAYGRPQVRPDAAREQGRDLPEVR